MEPKYRITVVQIMPKDKPDQYDREREIQVYAQTTEELYLEDIIRAVNGGMKETK